jgi:carboxylesterase
VSPVAGAEPFSHDGGTTGALLCHGFTGSPGSLRPWAHRLAEAGLTVRLPLLPGHGTRWQDMASTTWQHWYAAVETELGTLRERCTAVFVMGLSMGGTLAIRLAQQHPQAVSGLVLVNPSLGSEKKALRLVPALRFVVPSLRGVAGDIKKPGVDEPAYGRMSLHALHSLGKLWQVTSADLGNVTQPLLLFRSATDHVVEASSSRRLLAGISSTDVEERVLADSFHVATLDNDSEEIIMGSLQFVRRLAPASVEW